MKMFGPCAPLVVRRQSDAGTNTFQCAGGDQGRILSLDLTLMPTETEFVKIPEQHFNVVQARISEFDLRRVQIEREHMEIPGPLCEDINFLQCEGVVQDRVFESDLKLMQVEKSLQLENEYTEIPGQHYKGVEMLDPRDPLVAGWQNGVDTSTPQCAGLQDMMVGFDFMMEYRWCAKAMQIVEIPEQLCKVAEERISEADLMRVQTDCDHMEIPEQHHKVQFEGDHFEIPEQQYEVEGEFVEFPGRFSEFDLKRLQFECVHMEIPEQHYRVVEKRGFGCDHFEIPEQQYEVEGGFVEIPGRISEFDLKSLQIECDRIETPEQLYNVPHSG